MTINIKTDKSKYYYQVIKVLLTLPAFSKLMEREVQVLGQLLKHRDLIEAQGILETELQEGMLFSKHTKGVICRVLAMDDNSFRNNIYGLRKKGFISGTTLTLPVTLKYGEPLEFNFNEVQTIKS